MREFVPDKAIKPGAKKGTYQCNYRSNISAANLGKNGPGAGAGYRPANTEYQSAVHISPMESFVFYADDLPVDGFCPKFFQYQNRDDRYKNSKPDYAIHVESLEAEHFLDPEPANHFGFYKDNAKSYPD